MTDILDTIIAAKRQEIASLRAIVDIDMLIENSSTPRPFRSMRKALDESSHGIIAEFKRKSPSKGWIKPEGDSRSLPADYEHNGAAALSILTDTPFFGGSLRDIAMARPHTSRPILRKDFIIDEYQLYQARIIGADAVLLIAATLDPRDCRQLAAKAHELGLETLLEIHDEKELDHLCEEIDMVGVNNRHLGTFHTDVENSFRLAEQLPGEMLKISESGIARPETVVALRQAGFKGFLIGETFMRIDNPGEALYHFIEQLS